MARYRATVESPKSPEEVFAYLADFTTAAEWDPGTVSSVRIDDGPLREGSEFRVKTAFLGHESALRYRIVSFDAPRAVTLRGENATVVSLDQIAVERAGEGARVTYDAKITLKGFAKLAEPMFAIALRRIGGQALEGMRRALA